MLYRRRLRMLLCSGSLKCICTTLLSLGFISLLMMGIFYHQQNRISSFPEIKNMQHSELPIVNYEPFCGPHTFRRSLQLKSIPSKTAPHNSSICSVSLVDDSVCSDIFMRYHQTFPVEKCQSSRMDFCKLLDHSSIQYSNFPFHCDLAACSKKHTGSFAIINASSGALIRYKFKIDDFDAKHVAKVADQAVAERNPFMFLECTDSVSQRHHRQLLVLPYVSHPSRRYPDRKSFHININIMLIDSVSRPHFYRSLPNTVRYLENLALSDNVSVLDFELFHSIKDRTYENLKALFSGDAVNLGDKFEGIAEPPSRVRFEKLLDQFKTIGYETLYQEDLCWEYDWGLIKDTGVYMQRLPKDERFSVFMKAIRNSGIDNIGLSHSSCEIFRKLGIIDQFNFPDSICYGNRYQHDYFLDYLERALKNKGRKPLFSFLITDVGHEGTGKRIRTLDDSLVRFLSAVTSLEDTIHIIFSDHGNSYGAFSRTSEGLFETYHPFMFMVIPKKVVAKIGKSRMKHLMDNQRRLVTIRDLHKTLLQLRLISIGHNKSTHQSALPSMQGLFQPVPAARRCDDLGLLRNSLCYCQGWKMSLPVSSVHFLMAEYALAVINKKIVRSQLNKNDITAENGRVCQQLVGTNVTNIWQRKEKVSVTTGFDIQVQRDDSFSIVLSSVIDDENTFNFKIESVERRSSYGRYRPCANRNVALKFCVCSLKKAEKLISSAFPGSAFTSMFGVNTIYKKIDGDCLYILRRVYKAGVIFEASNACWNASYTVKLRLKLTNMKLAADRQRFLVPAGAFRHLAVVVMDKPGFEWQYEYAIELSKISPDTKTKR